MSEKVTKVKAISDMPEMVQFVYDFYQSRLNLWNKMRRDTQEAEQKARYEERKKRLDEEEEMIREKLEKSVEVSELRKRRRLNIDHDSSSDESDDEVVLVDNQEEKNVSNETQVTENVEMSENQETEAEKAPAEEIIVQDETISSSAD